jgi:hypothetical protein
MSSGTRDGTATTRQPVTLFEFVGQALEIRNALGDKFELFEAVQELRQSRGPAAPSPGAQKRAPHAMLRRAVALPMLVDGEIGADFGMLGSQLIERGHGACVPCGA